MDHAHASRTRRLTSGTMLALALTRPPGPVSAAAWSPSFGRDEACGNEDCHDDDGPFVYVVVVVVVVFTSTHTW